MVFKIAFLSSMTLTALALVGCDVFVSGHSHQDRVYAQPQPQYVQPQPQYVQAQPVYVEPEPQYIIVQQAPPPILVERRPAPPSSVSIWIDGSWNWDNQRYSWQAGHYAVPPQPDVIWVAASYQKDTHGYRYTPGQWKKRNPGNDRGRGHN